MLSTMRKHASSWMIKFIIGAITIVFIFWGVGSFRDRDRNHVAKVNGDGITQAEYRQTYDQMIDRLKQSFGKNLNDELLKMLNVRQQAMDKVIEKKLLLQEAERLDLRVTDKELAESINTVSYFQIDGKFDPRLYENVLNRNHLSPGQFEILQREDMLVEKVRAMMNAGIKVSDQEALQWYQWQNSLVDISFVSFDPEVQKNIDIDQAGIKAFFEQHKTDYETEPKIKVRYLQFKESDYQAKIKISADQIREYFQNNQEKFKTPAQVEARHILLRVAEDASEELVKARRLEAEKIVQQARGGADFAALAKKYSEGPTKDDGGYLGTFSRKNMVKPFADKAFSMKAGEISDPVRTQFGWHIIRVEKRIPASTKTLDEVREEIRVQLSKERARDLAYDDAESIFDVAFQGDDLVQAAEAHGVAVHTTDLFARSNPPKNLKNHSKFAEVAFNLVEMEISDIVDLDDGFYLLQVIETKAAQIPPLSEVEARVRADLVEKKKQDAAQAEAKAFLDKAKSAPDFAQAAKEAGRTVADTGWFKRNAEIPKIGYDQGIAAAAFNLSAKSKLPDDVLKGAKGYYVIAFKGRKAGAKDGFEAQKETIKLRLKQQKQQEATRNWLENARKNSEVTIVEGFLK